MKRERLDFLADNPFYTKRFAYYVGRRCRQAPIKDIAGELRLHWETVKILEMQEMQYMRAQLARVGTPGPKAIQDTRKPLRTWFLAMWFITSQKNGMSALGLQRALGLGSYETAWTWLHKLRRAMVRPGRDRLAGEIEVDETYVGGPEEGKRGRAIEKKSIVVVAAEKNGRAIGRIRLKRVKDVSAESLLEFIRDVVEPGATLHTDGWKGYAGLSAAGYKHRVTVISDGTDQAHEVMPRVHNVASLLKRWLLGTLQGGVQHQHLDYYLDEFTFRFNRRRSNTRGLLFYRLAQQAVAAAPAPYSSIVHGKSSARA